MTRLWCVGRDKAFRILLSSVYTIIAPSVLPIYEFGSLLIVHVFIYVYSYTIILGLENTLL